MIWNWKPEKDERLQKERGISFFEIVEAIAQGSLVAVLENTKGRDGWILVVEINGYIWAVPAKSTEEQILLWTAYPSRALQKKYGAKK